MDIPQEADRESGVITFCRICLETKIAISRGTCSHRFCDSCLYLYIKFRIDEGNVLELHCPDTSCRSIIHETEIRSLISTDLAKQFENLKTKQNLERNIKFRWCPNHKCEGHSFYEGSFKLACDSCGLEFCFLCASEWHPGSKCSGFFDEEFKVMAKKSNFKRCPKCFIFVEKDGGSDYVRCEKCRYYWCWFCETAGVHNLCKHTNGSCCIGVLWLLALLFSPITFMFSPVILYTYVWITKGGFEEIQIFRS